MERTLVILKPDAVQRGLIGQITARLEQRGLKLAGMKFIQIDNDLAARHYAVHKGKPFYEGLIKYITSSPVVVQVWEGKRVDRDGAAHVRRHQSHRCRSGHDSRRLWRGDWPQSDSCV